MTQSFWPDGFVIRAPRLDEAEQVTALICAGNLATLGEADWSIEEMRADWNRLGFELARDARIVVAPDGRLAAYAEVWARPNAAQIGGNSLVHPDFRYLELEDALTDLAEWLAAQHAPLPIRWHKEEKNGHMLAARGYEAKRWHWRMRIDFAGPPPEPRWPDGCGFRIMQEADERATQALIEQAFTQPDRAAVSFEEWRRLLIEREDFDRSLFFVATCGGEIVGAAACYLFGGMEEGWVRQLAVAEGYRGRGLGQALLRHAFGEFYRRGTHRAGLGVDAHNPSATKLYLGVGMHALEKYVMYEKASTGK